MAFPSKLLDDGEEVVVDIRAHVWALAGPITLAVLVIAGAGVAAAHSPPSPLSWVVVAVLVLVLANLLGRYLRWRATSLVVTTDRLVLRSGVVARNGREIPLGALTDISYRQGIFDRLIRAGDLLLESAGHEGQEVFRDAPGPAAVQREIYAVLSAREASRAAGPGLSLPEQLDRLDDLRRRGVITDAEFATTKGRLLGGR